MELNKTFHIQRIEILPDESSLVYELHTNLLDVNWDRVTVFFIEEEEAVLFSDGGYNLSEWEMRGKVFDLSVLPPFLTIENDEIIYRLPKDTTAVERKNALFQYLFWLEQIFEFHYGNTAPI